jgi:hypothetical protein
MDYDISLSLPYSLDFEEMKYHKSGMHALVLTIWGLKC